MTEKRPSGDTPFSADRPITGREHDRLGRTGFAQALARAVRGWVGRDSLVIALYGSWGSGKSSLKNMVLEELHTGSADVCITEFNPLSLVALPPVISFRPSHPLSIRSMTNVFIE